MLEFVNVPQVKRCEPAVHQDRPPTSMQIWEAVAARLLLGEVPLDLEMSPFMFALFTLYPRWQAGEVSWKLCE